MCFSWLARLSSVDVTLFGRRTIRFKLARLFGGQLSNSVRPMDWIIAAVIILGIVYSAAIVLAVRDRIFPKPANDLRAPMIARHPQFMKLRWFVLPFVVLFGLFGLAIWLIVFCPVFAWRGLSGAACRLTEKCTRPRQGIANK